MPSSNFIDYVKIYFRSGAGGAGSVHFHREKFISKGGPDGGNGGRGGHIILKGNAQLWTLLHLKYRKHIRAEDGQNGASNLSSGKQGKDIVIEVPIGTVAKDADTGAFVNEITKDQEEIVLLEGGKGGLGNAHFKSATNQSPQYAQPGLPRQEMAVILELKLLADVGLVGFPNAGKSTLLSVLSAAKPEIADYPFTTLVPNLGVVAYRDSRSFVMADIPGIIEGAAEGKGLGIRFLRHIERNACLLFVVSAESEDIAQGYFTLLNELKKYNPELLDKKRLLAITKADFLDEELQTWISEDLDKHENMPEYLFISSVLQKGLEKLKDKLMNILVEI